MNINISNIIPFFCGSWYSYWSLSGPWRGWGRFRCPCSWWRGCSWLGWSTCRGFWGRRTSWWCSGPALSRICCATCWSDCRTFGTGCSSSLLWSLKCNPASRSSAGDGCSSPAHSCTSSSIRYGPTSAFASAEGHFSPSKRSTFARSCRLFPWEGSSAIL